MKNLFKKIALYFFAKRWIKPSQKEKINHMLRHVPFEQLKYISRFLSKRSRKKSILIIEGNLFHGEVIPGLVQYLNQLGYHVDLLLHNSVIDEDPFVRCDFDMSIFEISFESLALIIHLEELGEYEAVLINSTQQWNGVPGNDVRSFKEYYGTWPRGKHASILMEHDMNAADAFFRDEPELMGRLITLGHFPKGRMVNSHYFGPVKKHKKNETTTFALIGGIAAMRRNHQLVLRALEKLSKEKYDFNLLIVGSGELHDLPDILHKHVKILGRLNFSDMYNVIENSDFLLAGLDPDNLDHDRYISTGVTGTAQICYGFEIPLIIEKKFAGFYGYNNENAIVYAGDLKCAIQEAINMNDEEYQEKRHCLGALAASIREESINNLAQLLPKIS